MPPSNQRLTDRNVLIIAILTLLIPVAWIEYSVLKATHGVLAYPMDDTFIHMVVAKNLAFEHYWGISGHAFASTSSSPFYTVLLAITFKLFGAHLVIPLILNILSAILVLLVMHNWLKRQGLTAGSRLLILILVNFLTPLPMLVIAGMEHTFQLLFTFLFVFTFADAAAKASNSSEPGTRLPWPLFVYGALMVTTRYECLPILAIACLILVFRKKRLSAIALGAISVIPITIFGLYAISKGSYFMPNSVILKPVCRKQSSVGQNSWGKIFGSRPSSRRMITISSLPNAS